MLDGAQYILIPSFGSKSKGQNETVLARARENGVPIVEANVGVNMIVSKGEVVAYAWGNDRITTATIDIPAPASTEAARAHWNRSTCSSKARSWRSVTGKRASVCAASGTRWRKPSEAS